MFTVKGHELGLGEVGMQFYLVDGGQFASLDTQSLEVLG